uniref:Uncharacterized protein n=1 Tax=Panagrolaimus sp. ES5 TaxID=591445 RepID=A0AC34FPM1_9BILA
MHCDGEFVTKHRKSPPDFSWKKTILRDSRNNLPTVRHKKKRDKVEDDVTDFHDNEDEDNPQSRDENVGLMILNELGLENE